MRQRLPTPTNGPDPIALTHTRQQAAARLNIGLNMLGHLIASHEIRVIRIGKRVLVPEVELQRMIETRLAGKV